MKPADLITLEALIRPAVDGQGYELVDLEWKREQGGNVLRLYIDRLSGQGYVSLDDCAKISHEVSTLLDVHEAFPGVYNLEVSSPGVNRPLKRPADFARFISQRAKVRLRPEAARPMTSAPHAEESVPRRNFLGKIKSVQNDTLRLITDDAGEVDLCISEIDKANLVYEPETPSKKLTAKAPPRNRSGPARGDRPGPDTGPKRGGSSQEPGNRH